MRCRRALRIAAAVTVALAATVPSLAGVAADLVSPLEELAIPTTSPLRESASCGAPRETTAPIATPPAPSGGTLVTFTIPPTTAVMTDGARGVVAVRTNTGCRPAAGDVMREITPAGSVPVSDAVRSLVLTYEYDGDWTNPGEWHAVGPIHI